MGKIIETGLKIVCDRCDKPKDVIEEKQIEFYKTFSKKKDRDDQMFAFVLNSFEGTKSVGFEYLCPDCVAAIAGYVGKCEKPKGRGGKEDKEPPATTDPPKTEEKKAEVPKTETPKSEEKKPEEKKTKPPPEEKPATTAADDDDIFDS